MPEEGSISIEQLLLTRLSKSDFKKWVDNSSAPYKELMAYYRCAIMEIEKRILQARACRLCKNSGRT